MYASGFDLVVLVLCAWCVHMMLIMSVVVIVLFYIGIFVLNVVDSIMVMTLVFNGLVVLWVVVNLFGFLVVCWCCYDLDDL